VQGLELSAKWRPATGLSVSADYLYSDATVRATALAPGLIGKRLAQVPRHSAALGAEWRVDRLTFAPRLRLIGRQFEDDENQLVLGAAVIADLGASYRLHPGGELFVTVENLGDTRLETGRSPDGLVNTGTPRLALGGVRLSW
jgi:outer membrane receptor protein involved in Fe transport